MSNVRVPPRRPPTGVVIKNVKSSNGSAGPVVVRPAVMPNYK